MHRSNGNRSFCQQVISSTVSSPTSRVDFSYSLKLFLVARVGILLLGSDLWFGTGLFCENYVPNENESTRDFGKLTVGETTGNRSNTMVDKEHEMPNNIILYIRSIYCKESKTSCFSKDTTSIICTSNKHFAVRY